MTSHETQQHYLQWLDITVKKLSKTLLFINFFTCDISIFLFQPPIRKQLTESQIKLKRPESENLVSFIVNRTKRINMLNKITICTNFC